MKKDLQKVLNIWYVKYKEFIEQKTTNYETGKEFYSHQKQDLLIEV